MVHLSRLAEELTWWSNPRFGFVRVADAFSTGSSMMPNKKNPDPAELVRGRSAGVIGALTAMLTLLKGLPLAYQRDLQEDKPAFFAAVATLDASLAVMAGLVETLAIDRDRGCARPPRRATRPPPRWPTRSSGAASRSAPPTTSSAGSWVGPRPRGSRSLAALPDEAFRAALDGSDDETARGLATEKGIGAALRAAATIEGSLAART